VLETLGVLIIWSREIKIRAERRVGQLLREMERAEQRRTAKAGRPKKASSGAEAFPRLKDFGLSENQSADWQQLAAIPSRNLCGPWTPSRPLN
jgi:hypothetical protein